MKGKVATARIELAIPHLEGFFCENYIFNILYYHIFQCVIIQRKLLIIFYFGKKSFFRDSLNEKGQDLGNIFSSRPVSLAAINNAIS